ncbi:MAG: hypothetical protein HY040_27955 [Planctomycetes bacterium]|nr:hypothetical protein [Planctomycetota bacterium]
MRPFKPEHYFRAALERMRQAQLLYRQDESFALAMYVAGVAIECLLRAFKGRKSGVFDERHDLRLLFHASGIIKIGIDGPHAKGLTEKDLEVYRRELQAALLEICLLWSNDLRFASEDRLRSHLKKQGSFRKRLKGDMLKAMALKLLQNAQLFIDRGARLWIRQ